MTGSRFRYLCLLGFTALWILLCLLHTIPVSASKEPRANDKMETAIFFGDIPAQIPPNLTPPPEWVPGMTQLFHILNITSGELYSCTARIFFITENIVFWLDENETQIVPESILTRLQAFDRGTLPVLHSIFGEENKPGIDNDNRFHVLFTGLIGNQYNGYFSAEDTADPRIHPASNGMDLLILNTALLSRGEDAVIDTLSHEYQHMIHFHYDQNEQSFLNEGLSGLAEYLSLGTIRDTFIRNYLYDTGRSLIWWPDSENTAPYYGSSFLFSTYLWDRFGPQFIHDLIRRPENGFNGIDWTLKQRQLPYTADEIFQQWTAALLGQLLRSPVRDWDYRNYIFPRTEIYRDIRTLSCGISETHETAQYGIRLYNSNCPGAFTITADGQAENAITTLQIPSGESAWWSGAVNNSMAYLSHDFDLTGVSGAVRFEYDTDFDIESGYDYYYLLLKDEAGMVTRLSPSTASAYDPAQLNMGSGTTGRSGGTIHESIDLSQWSGQKIHLTFVYLTDTATIGDGILLDNIKIDAIGFLDADDVSQEWQAEGFSKIRKSVPQRFSLTVLHPQNNGTTRAEFLTFDGGTPITADCPEGNCAFAISPINRDIRSRSSFTVQTAPYGLDSGSTD